MTQGQPVVAYAVSWAKYLLCSAIVVSGVWMSFGQFFAGLVAIMVGLVGLSSKVVVK